MGLSRRLVAHGGEKTEQGRGERAGSKAWQGKFII